jgi:hypothetical protein
VSGNIVYVRLWQPALSMLIAVLISALIDLRLAFILLLLGLPAAISSYFMVHGGRRRYLRAVTPTGRNVAATCFITLLIIVVAVTVALRDRIGGTLITVFTLSSVFSVTVIPSLTRSLKHSAGLRFREAVWSELLASVISGLILSGVFVGVDLLGVVPIFSGGS